MLILGRKVGERIWIGDDCYVMVVRIDRHQAAIGIQAPSDVVIERDELRKPKGGEDNET